MAYFHEATGTISGGKLTIKNRRAFDAIIGSWPDCPVTLTIEKRHATRSHAQNRLYWGVYIRAIAEHTGLTPDEAHAVLKARFIPKHLAIQGINGELLGEFVVGGSTRRMNKVEFGDYLRDIHQWASEKLGLHIPEPTAEAA